LHSYLFDVDKAASLDFPARRLCISANSRVGIGSGASRAGHVGETVSAAGDRGESFIAVFRTKTHTAARDGHVALAVELYIRRIK
jgi:hypothetical protein